MGNRYKRVIKKGEIIAAARRCFAKHGFARTTVEDIARVVGIKAGSLYHYYDSKETIFREVIIGEGKEMLGWLKGEVTKEKTAKKKVLRYIRARLEHFRSMTNLLDVSIQVVVEVAPLVDKLYREYLDQEVSFLAGIINSGIKDGSFLPCNGLRIASAILTMSESVKYKAFRMADTLSASEVDYSAVDKEVSYITELILAGVAND
ncbi:putative TetR/AcrR family transcriptional regulator [Candidatus Zixiibacteriota bacterium]|nr:putative TetR/AcrR family transcriptional regulator [candidate division Zixibacteria bacterium]